MTLFHSAFSFTIYFSATEFALTFRFGSLLPLLLFLIPSAAHAQHSDYYCPERPLSELASGVDLAPVAAIDLPAALEGLCSLYQFENGAVLFHAKMDIDADGSPNALDIDPDYGQLTTAFTYRGYSGQTAHVDAERVPYIVLPQRSSANQDFYARTNIGLGDIAAVIYRGRVEFALVADIGPPDKIGEGSIALAQSLGHNPFAFRHGQKIVDRAIPGGVIYIVFPGTRMRDVTPDNILQRLRERGEQLLANITIEDTSE